VIVAAKRGPRASIKFDGDISFLTFLQRVSVTLE
jgi:hypothetical protein